jgi:hypothetical protein
MNVADAIVDVHADADADDDVDADAASAAAAAAVRGVPCLTLAPGIHITPGPWITNSPPLKINKTIIFFYINIKQP